MLIPFAFGCANGEKITLEGEVRLKGFAHDPLIVLIDNKGKSYRVINPNEFDLNRLQRSRLKVKAELIQSETKTFPPMKQIRILSIETFQ